MTSQQNTRGFTLIELIIALSMFSILSAYAIPNYRTFKQNQLMTQEINRLVATINYARSHSIIANKQVILCPTVTFTECDAGSTWHKGWIVFEDLNFDKTFNGEDVMLLNENSMPDQLQAVASLHRQKIRFDPRGFAPGTNLTIRYCDDRGSEHGKAIIISNVGRPRTVQQIQTCG